MSQELSSNQSVLQQHHLRNRIPKAPAPLSPQPFSPPPQLVPAPLPATPQRATPLPATSRPNTPLPATPQPTTPRPASEGRSTLDTYPPLWRGVINNAKKTFRVYLAGKNGFPDAPNAVEEAGECLEDALAVHYEEGKAVEESKHNLCWSDGFRYSLTMNQHTRSAGTWQCL